MDEDYAEIYEKLNVFLIESIDFLKNEFDISQIPCTDDTQVRYDKTEHRFVKENGLNWHQLKIPRKILQLPSYFEIVDKLKKHPVILERDNKISYAFQAGTTFIIDIFPVDFLKKYLIRQKKIEFDSKIFDSLFEDFLNYIDPKKQDFACIVVPFDNFILSNNVSYIDSDLRIRVLDKAELVDMINHNDILHHFYGALGQLWFVCILEIAVPFQWSWVREKEDSAEISYFATRNPEIYEFIDRKINQEIIILRTVYNRAITAPTFFVDYRGWMAGSVGRTIRYLPWRRHPFFPITDRFDTLKYCEYRNKMHSIDKKYRQRLFVAMRKFAYSLEKMYPGDRLVDTISGLEGLVIGDSKPEISHRFAERVSLLLENDPIERLKLLADMKKAYGLRSSVAHGTAIIDNFDFFSLQSEKIQGISGKKYNDSQKLLGITHLKLQEAIFLCLDRQSTDFNWDEIIMGTTIKP